MENISEETEPAAIKILCLLLLKRLKMATGSCWAGGSSGGNTNLGRLKRMVEMPCASGRILVSINYFSFCVLSLFIANFLLSMEIPNFMSLFVFMSTAEND